MDDTFLRFYEEELSHIRGMAADFGEQYPQVAGRLRISPEACADPFVERMLEGFAFLAARVRQKLDAEYPVFTESLTETVYPHLLAPVPSMTIVGFEPDEGMDGPALIPRHTQLTSHLIPGADTRCQFRTVHDVKLYPARIDEDCEPHYYSRDLDRLRVPSRLRPKGALRIRIRHSQEGTPLSEIEDLDELTFFLSGDPDYSGRVYEELMAHCTHVIAKPSEDGTWHQEAVISELGKGSIALEEMGFRPDQSLLPVDARVFDGHRILREYVAMPERFLFVKLAGEGLKQAVQSCEETGLDLIFLFDRSREELTRLVNPERFRLYATPAINLFEQSADQIAITQRFPEHRIVVDHNRPLDYEVHSVLGVVGISQHSSERTPFEPFYRCRAQSASGNRFYTLRREPRRPTRRERQLSISPEYLGTDAYLGLVDGLEAPVADDLVAVSVRVLCSNRHLPQLMQVGERETDFFADAGLECQTVRVLTPPTAPFNPVSTGERAWGLISHLALNYLSLVGDSERGAEPLRDILRLHARGTGTVEDRWIEGLVNVEAKPVVRRFPGGGTLAFGRGLSVTLEVDEGRLAGSSPFLFGRVLAHFLANYVTINSFVDCVLKSRQRGELAQWPAALGQRPVL